jgi:hypothetical protein
MGDDMLDALLYSLKSTTAPAPHRLVWNEVKEWPAPPPEPGQCMDDPSYDPTPVEDPHDVILKTWGDQIEGLHATLPAMSPQSLNHIMGIAKQSMLLNSIPYMGWDTDKIKYTTEN